MMLDPQADPGRRAWLPCPHCYDNPALLYLLDFDINLVWVQCANCLRRWWHTGVGHRKHPEHLFDVA
ncbi:MAG TPA: hypothetical protein VGO16_15550 [Pseudonocardiaceae bacterium]|jgi:hypothetical protein|nr:hypothetical protein [Pseudonocardiaceae bacterium]